MSPTPLARLKGLAALALQHADGERAVLAGLQQAPLSGPVRVLALGKAAAAMWRGAARALANQLRAVLVIAPAPPNEADAFWQAQQAVPVQWRIGSHPLPDQRSLAAGAMARRFVAATTPDETLLVLLSGGASALCEDLPAGVSLAELQALQQALLAADWPIAHINAMRQRLSTIKAGGLARCCPTAESSPQNRDLNQ